MPYGRVKTAVSPDVYRVLLPDARVGSHNSSQFAFKTSSVIQKAISRFKMLFEEDQEILPGQLGFGAFRWHHTTFDVRYVD